MKKLLAVLVSAALSLVPLNAVAAVKAGDVCKKVGTTATANGKKYTCIKSGKKLVWNKGVAITPPKPSVTPTPIASPSISPQPILEKTPTSFGDLVENYKGSYINAWIGSDSKIRANNVIDVKQNIILGPLTKLPNSEIPAMYSRGTQFFAGYPQPKQFNAIYYVYDDITWAQAKILELYENPREPEQIPRNCQTRERCNGANANVPKPSIGHANFGVMSTGIFDDYHGKGGIEIHEYAHMVQFMQFEGKPTNNRNLSLLPNWFIEGHAHLAGNVAAAKTLEDYKQFRKPWLKARPEGLSGHTQEGIEDFYSRLAAGKSDPSVVSNVYSIGYFTLEAMVAVKGIDSPMELIKAVSEGDSWDSAFLKVYGISWKEAAPILAKAVSRIYLER